MKNTRTITYRRAGTPSVILEGKWLENKLGWKLGDQIEVILRREPFAFEEGYEIVLKKIETPKS